MGIIYAFLRYGMPVAFAVMAWGRIGILWSATLRDS
jgi:hypothetical protein